MDESRRFTSVDRRQWAMIALLHGVVGIAGTVTTAKGVFFPSLVTDFELSHAAAGALMSSTTIVGGLVALLVGFLLVRGASVQFVLGGTTALVGLGYLISSVATDYTHLLLGYAAMAGGNVTVVAIPFFVTRTFDRHRALAMALIFAGTTTGGVLLTPALTAIMGDYGWRVAYRVLAATLLIGCAPLILSLVRVRAAPDAAAGGTAEDGLGFRAGLRKPTFWMILIAYAAFAGNTGVYFTHFIPAMLSNGLDASFAAWLMSILFLLAAAAKLAYGYLSDRTNVSGALAASFLIGAAGVAALQWWPGATGRWMFALGYGLSYSAPLVLFPVLIAETFGRRRFAIFEATIAVSGTFIGAAGPVLAGRIYDSSGSYSAAFNVMASVMAIVGLLTLAIPLTDGRRMAASRLREVRA